MYQSELHSMFSEPGLIVLPVIHVLDTDQACRNIQMAMDGGCKGVFLINHEFEYELFLPIIREVRNRYPDFWIFLR